MPQKGKKTGQRPTQARVVKHSRTGELVINNPTTGVTCKRCEREPPLRGHKDGWGLKCIAETGNAATQATEPLDNPMPSPSAVLVPGDFVAKAPERRIITAREAVQAELAQRELARRKLLHFIIRRFPSYDAGWMHIDICERVEKFVDDVLNKRSPRMILTTPPRHGKSMIVSENLEPWALGNHPSLKFISASYSAQLAEEFSRKVQDIIRSADYGALFPEVQIDPRAQAISSWSTTKGGALLPVGVGGAMTGFGADILNIDDPVKNREEAESTLISKAIWDWYTSTAYTRLMPGGGVLITMTRWRDNDLVGRLLEQMAEAEKIERETGVWPAEYDKWEVVHYPAIAISDEKHRKMGDALHPSRYSLAALKKIKKTIGDRDFNALYQGTPTAAEGEYFKEGFLRWYSGSPPSNLKIYTAADLAISKKEWADYSVIVTVGVAEDGRWYVLDMRRGRWGSLEIVDQLIDVFRTWKPLVIGIEEGQIEKAIGPFLDKRIEEERLHEMYVEGLPPGKRDKELRARPLQGRMAQGLVSFPQDAPWVSVMVSELLRFPAGVKDDIVDALAWIGQMLNIIVLPPRPQPKRKKSWRDDLKAADTAGTGDPMAA